MKTVPLGGKKAAGRVALVDDEDYDLVMAHRWHVFERRRPDRRKLNGPYARANVTEAGRRKSLYMHRILVGWPLVDHIDGNGLNNQRANLRPATHAQNRANSAAGHGTSLFRGVSWDRQTRRWLAQIKNGPENYRLGRFLNEEDAARAYDRAALEAWGEFAALNFPVGG